MSDKHKSINTVDILERMLDTLESRREQLSTRSTVSLAASSGLLVLVVQFIFDVSNYNKCFLINSCMILCVICMMMSGLSIITSLDLIKRISRKKYVGRGQNASDPNIFYFGWIAEQSEDELANQLILLSFNEQVKFEIRQAISLSKNLDYRYNQLRKTYNFFAIGLVAYLLSIIAFIFFKYI